MKILLSPAKDMTVKLLSRPRALMKAEEVAPNEHTRAVLSCLRSLSLDEVGEVFHLRGKTLAQTHSYFHEAYEAEPAGEVYAGLAYKALAYPTLPPQAQAYLDEHLLILSALYGPLSPKTKILPYRLDFSLSLRRLGIDLQSSWQKHWGAILAGEDLILNLASQEFASLFDAGAFGAKWIDFAFFEENQAGQRKQHSTLSKKGRGALARTLALNEVTTLDQVKNLVFDGFTYRAELSTNQHLVFVRMKERHG